MRFEPTGIAGVTLVRLDPKRDERGSFTRTFCEAEFARAGFPFRIVQANRSFNVAALTLRGMHFQKPPHGEPKIVSCRRGRVWDVAVDVRPDSPSYLHWRSAELSPDSDTAFLLGEGIAHGFLTLEPESEVEYLMGAEYVPDSAAGLRWDDPAVGIAWPAEPDVISPRDQAFAPIDRRR